MHWGKGSGRCELQVDLSSTSLLASATRVSHGMQWHQIFSEHAAKKEEWCPPGQRAGTLNWSSAAHKCREEKKNNEKQKLKIWYFQLQVEQTVCLTFIFQPPTKSKKVHPCAFWQRWWKWGRRCEKRGEKSSLCCLQAVQTQVWGAPSPICALSLSRVESRREGAREQDREGERVSNSGVRLSQSVKSVRQSGRQQGSVYVGPSRLHSHSQDL